MEFVELEKEDFNQVCNKFDGNSFYQTCNWAKIKEYNGWIHYFVGVKKENKIVACTLILGKKIYSNKFIYYAPRGMLLNYNDYELLNFFVNKIKKFLINKNGIIFKIDPLIRYRNHDRNGNCLNDDFSNQNIVNNLINLGFNHRGFTIGYSDEAQFRWSYCLNINSSKEEIFRNMNQRCRRCIRKYEKYPLEMVDVNDNNIQDFKDIMEHTAKRQNHFDRSLDYYKNINKNFCKKSKLVIIYLDRNKFLDNNKDDKLYDTISKDKRSKIPISAGLFIFDSNRTNYVYGGTYTQYMSLMAQYKIQMEMIYLSQKLGISLYDFGGISGNFKHNSKNFGVYEFKRGFGGYVVEYIGEFDLILDKIGYNIYNKSYKLYRSLKHLIAKKIRK